jgi:HEAT repeat protein
MAQDDFDLDGMDFEDEDLSDPEAKSIDFNEVIDALLDDAITFPPRFLYRFSGLEGLDLEQLADTWPQVDPLRRQRLLEDLEILADKTTHLDFDQVFQLGLKEDSPHARRVAVRGLWESESSAVARQLLRMLVSDDAAEVRAQAARGLGKFVYLGEVGDLDPGLFQQITRRLIVVTESSQPEDIRQGALESLGFSNLPQLDALIESALAQEKEDWHISGLIAAGRTANDQWLPQIIADLNHDSLPIRLEAVQAAGLLAAQPAVSHLLQLIDDPETEVRKAAIWALSEIGGLDARAAIEALARNTIEEDEAEFLEEALENLDYNEMGFDFRLLEMDEPDPDLFDEDEDLDPEA